MPETFRVLVVEDDIDDARFVLNALEHENGEVAVEATPYAERALELLAEQRFDCVLLDYRLPRMDGKRFLQVMREQGLATPVVVLTGRGSPYLAQDLLDAGAAGYLDKDDASPDRVRTTLRNALGLDA